MSAPARPAALASRSAQGAVLSLAAFLAPPLSIFAPLGMAPLFAVSALALLVADMIASRGLPRATWTGLRASPLLARFALLAALLLAWMAASAAWAVEPRQALTASGQMLGTLVAALVHMAIMQGLDARARRLVGRALLAGMLIAFVILVAELFDGAWLARHMRIIGEVGLDQVYSRYNRSLTVLLMLLAPALLAMNGATKRLAVGLAMIVLVMAYYGSSLQVAVIAGLAAVLLTLILPRAAPWLMGAALAAFVAAAPLLPALTKTVDTAALTERSGNVSIAHRLIIWRFSAERIADKPLAGWGMNAARAIPGGNEKVPLSGGDPPAMGEKLPLHTHNAPLQWWLELGAIGAAMMVGLWLLALAAIVRHIPARAPRALAFGGYSAAFLVAGLSFGAWQAWWLATLGFAAALVGLLLPPARDEAA